MHFQWAQSDTVLLSHLAELTPIVSRFSAFRRNEFTMVNFYTSADDSHLYKHEMEHFYPSVLIFTDVISVLPSAQQSTSLLVQGLGKVNAQSLAVLFCLSVSFATLPPACRRVFRAGRAG